jgi:eukaryotic-like serine/threonine-protein kinase
MTPAGHAERLEAVEQADTLEMRRPGLVLGRYRLGERLGEGGFGTVWLAHDERLHRAVALKRIPIEPGTGTERAEREALAAARLGHPGIVALYEAGHDDDAFYLASELVRGRTLAQLEADGALSDRDVVRIGAALCGALEHAHARGVVHRDVKPGNVIVADDGTVKLTDFGIARLADSSSLTLTGDVVGTIAYMAPEQAEGRRVTGAADLYALALVLFEALTGTNPVRAEGAAATARRVGMRLPPLGRVRPPHARGSCR